MRRLLLGLGVLGLAAVGFHGLAVADDPPAPAGGAAGGGAPAPATADPARVRALVENLGSEDFRIREEASKELAALGEAARPALEEARKSDVPEVRFRADQLLRRLDKNRGDRRLDDGTGGATPGARDPRRRLRTGWPQGFAPGAGGFDMEEWAKQLREQIDRIQREAENFGSGHGGWGLGFPGLDPLWNSWGGPSSVRTLKSEAGTLVLSPRGAHLFVADKAADGSTVTATYDGRSLEAILSAHGDLVGHPGMAALAEQAKAADAEMKKAQEEARNAAPLGRGGFSFRSDAEGTQIEVGPNGAKVTITEAGPDGKPVSKVYEGKDLETIKREHPEIANRIGHFAVHLGPVPPGAPRAAPDADDDDGDDDADGKGATPPAPAPVPGPFGIEFRPAPTGIRIAAVVPKSDAEAAGLRAGDLVTAINGTRIDATTSVPDLVRAGRAAGSLVFDVTRDGAPTKVTWTRK